MSVVVLATTSSTMGRVGYKFMIPQAMKKLKAAVKPYLELERFHAELMALHSLHMPKARPKAKAAA